MKWKDKVIREEMVVVNAINSTEHNYDFFNRITRLYFVLSIFVIFIHANNLIYYEWSDGNMIWTAVYYIEKLLGSGIGNICVPTFFLLSGYLFFRNLDVFSADIWTLIRKKQLRRVRTLLVPYLIWNSLYMLFYMFIARIPVVSNFMRNQAMKISFVNIVKGIFFHEANFVFWYMATLIILVALTPLIAFILKRKGAFAIAFVLIAIGGIMNLQLPDFECKFVVFFLLGSYLAVYGKEFFEKQVPNSAILILVAFIVFSIFYRTFVDDKFLTTIVLYCTPVCVWIVSQKLKFKITDFMRQTFFIYAGHVFIVTMINKVLLKLGNASAVWAIVSYLIAPIFTLAVLWCLYRLLIKIAPRVYGVLCGDRG